MQQRALLADQFEARKIGDKSYLTLQLPGKTVVFFKSSGCNICTKFSPIFAEISRTHQNFKGDQLIFGYLDVSTGYNKNIVGIAKMTTSPIQSVPTIMFFLDGTPIAKLVLNGSSDAETIRGFLHRAYDDAVIRERGSRQQTVPFRQPYQQPQMPQYHPSQQQPHSQQRPSFAEVESDDGNKLIVPPAMIPHNNPWMSETSKRYDGFD